MEIAKVFAAALLVPALVAPSIASAAVRPSVKPVVAPAKQGQRLALRTDRAGAKVEEESNIFLAGLPLLAIAAIAVAAVVTVAAVADDGASPG